MAHPPQHKADILVVDDSIDMRAILTHLLERHNYRIHPAHSGEAALSLIAERGLPHLAIVDVHMPGGMDGLQFCDELGQFTDVPAVMLTAVEDEKVVVHALRQHVEDYLIKPFNPEELIARVGRVLQRIGKFPYPMQAPLSIDGNLAVDFGARALILDDKKKSLTPTEARLLYILLRTVGKTIDKAFLVRRMWPLELADEDRLHVYVHRLRSKLKRSGDDHRYIVSERGVGYRFQPHQAETVLPGD